MGMLKSSRTRGDEAEVFGQEVCIGWNQRKARFFKGGLRGLPLAKRFDLRASLKCFHGKEGTILLTRVDG